MTATLIIFGLLALVLGAFAVKNDTYSSPAAAVGLSFARAGVVTLLLALALARPEGEPPRPRLLFIVDQEAQAAADTPRRLARIAAAAVPWAVGMKFFAAGPPQKETPSLDGDTFLGYPLSRFPSMDVTLEAARWEAARSGTCQVVVLAGAQLPQGASDLGQAGPRILTVARPRTRAIQSMVLPTEGFAKTPVQVRLELFDVPEAAQAEIFVDDRFSQMRPLRDRKGRLAAGQTFSIELPAPGPHTLSALVRDGEGQVVDRRSEAVHVQALPRILYVSPPGVRSPLQEMLQRRGFEVSRYTASSILDEEGSPFKEARAGDIVVLDSPSRAYLGAQILASATESVFDRGASMLLVAGDALREGDRGAPLERIWPARLGLERPETEDRVLALVAVVDTSMSMSFPEWDSSQGARKIDLAKAAVANLARAMRDKDRLGVLGSDFNPYWVVDLKDDPDPGEVTELIGRVVAFGPGINLYSSLLAAIEGLEGIKADIKHVLVLADTADIDEYEVSGTGTVWDLLERCRVDGITVSVVGFGGSDEEHVPLLNRLTEASGGFLYLATKMADVPGFFLEDLEQVGDSLVVRSRQNVLFREEEFPALEGGMPRLEGQVLVSPKPGARVLAWTERDYTLFSSWRVGRGSVGLFASDNGSTLSAGWADDSSGPLWDSLLAKMLPSDPPAQVFADLEQGRGRIFVRVREPAAPVAPLARWFRPGGEPLAVNLEMTAPFEYTARVPELAYGSHLLEVTDPGGGWTGPLAAMSLPLSPAGGAPAQAGDSPLAPPEEPARASVTWRDARILRLLLLLAMALLVVDELFRAP